MRSEKGVTPAIATVLLLGIVVSSTGAAFTFILTSQGEITDDLESDLTTEEKKENTRFNIESVQSDGKIEVRNTGSVDINLSSGNLEIIVDNERLDDRGVTNGDDENILTPNEAGTVKVNEDKIGENTRIRLIGPFGSSDTYIYF